MRRSLEALYLYLIRHRSYFVLFLLSPLIPLSYLFYLALSIRKWKKKKLCATRSLQTPIITVGNITMGGTGKTPAISLLVQHLKNEKIGYASSGYRRKQKGFYCSLKSPLDIEHAGDEASLLAQRYPNVILAIDDDKWTAVQALDKNVDLIFLDDGLQRYDIPIALSIATVNCSSPDGYGWLLPRGLLREPVSRLANVDYIILTYPSSQEEALSLKRDFVDRFNKPTIVTAPKLTRFFSPSGETISLTKQQPIALFSAIANSENFRRMMESFGYCVLDHMVFSDHQHISQQDLVDFNRKQPSSTILVGTEKDWAREIMWPDLPIAFTQMDFDVISGKQEFDLLIQAILSLKK